MNSVNELAPFISVSFLLVFAATNLTCATLDLSAAPNFRYASILTDKPIHFKYLKSGVCVCQQETLHQDFVCDVHMELCAGRRSRTSAGSSRFWAQSRLS